MESCGGHVEPRNLGGCRPGAGAHTGAVARAGVGAASHRPGPLRAHPRCRLRARELADLLGQLRVSPLLAAGPDQRRQRGGSARGVGLPDGRGADRDDAHRGRRGHVRDRAAQRRGRARRAHGQAPVEVDAADGVGRAAHRLSRGEPGRGDPGLDAVRGDAERAPGGARRAVGGGAAGMSRWPTTRSGSR